MRNFFATLFWTFKFGPRNLRNRIANNRGLWEIDDAYTVIAEGTSITDSEFLPDYAATCDLVGHDDGYFKKFRRSRALISALDHVSIEQGFGYLREIEKFYEWQPHYKLAIEAVDAVGDPRTYDFNDYGRFSPTLVRYLKVYLDLKRLFGDLSPFEISEIGVGFGGQAALIGQLGGYKSYNFFDLPPVLSLAKKVLEKTGSPQVNQFHDGRHPAPANSDLVISNYAFSELSRDIQVAYLDRVILSAKRGYITWNNLSYVRLDGFSLAELVRLIPNSEIMAEVPYTHDGNVILYWGENKTL
jgi:hypothetical protein